MSKRGVKMEEETCDRIEEEKLEFSLEELNF